MRNLIKDIFFESRKRFRVGVVGYSDKKFDKKKALELIREGFDDLVGSKKDVEIVSGLTNVGIPAIAYKEAVKRGYRTVGIACVKAEDYECFPCDKIVTIGEDWGDESKTFLDNIDVLLRIGGGKQSLKEVSIAKERGMKVVEFELEVE